MIVFLAETQSAQYLFINKIFIIQLKLVTQEYEFDLGSTVRYLRTENNVFHLKIHWAQGQSCIVRAN